MCEEALYEKSRIEVVRRSCRVTELLALVQFTPGNDGRDSEALATSHAPSFSPVLKAHHDLEY